MKKILFIIFGLIIVVSIFFKFFLKKTVNGIKLEKKDYIEKIIVSGVVEGEERSFLSSGIGGDIEKIFFQEGDFVKKNETLITINKEELEKKIRSKKYQLKKYKIEIEKIESISLEIAKSNFISNKTHYNLSKNEYEKYKKLYNEKYVNVLEYNEKKNRLFYNKKNLDESKNILDGLNNGVTKKMAIAQMESIRNELKELEKSRSKYFIKAPYDLFILKKYINSGERVSSYDRAFLVTSSDNQIIKINLDEKYIDKVNLKDKMDIYFSENEDIYFEGIITSIGIFVDENNGTVEIKGEIKDNKKSFLYNQSINGVIYGLDFKNCFLINYLYIMEKDNKKHIYIYKKNKIELIEIKGFEVIDGFVVTNLKDSEIVVLYPENLNLKDKIKVKFKGKDYEI